MLANGLFSSQKRNWAKGLTTLILLLVMSFATRALADEASRQDAIGRYKNWLLAKRAEWLNAPVGAPVDPDVLKVENKINTIIETFKQNNPKLNELPIHVHIFKSDAPNAWVASHLQSQPFGFDLEKVTSAFGYDPNKGFIELGVTTGLFHLVESMDGLKFILGHEMGHILEGHVPQAKDVRAEDIGKGWWDSQVREFAADSRGIDLNTRLSNLDEAFRTMWKLFQWGESRNTERTSLTQKVIQALRSSGSTHPHEGARLAALQAYIRWIKSRTIGYFIPVESLHNEFTAVADKYQSSKEITGKERGILYEIFKNKRAHSRVESLLQSMSHVKKVKILNELIEICNSQTSDPRLKLEVAFFMLNAISTDFKKGDFGEADKVLLLNPSIREIEKMKFLDHFEVWLSQTPPESIREIQSEIAQYDYAHQVLLALSHGDGAKVPRKHLNRFILGASDQYIESKILVSESSAERFGKQLRAPGHSGLKRRIILRALESLNRLNFETMGEVSKRLSTQGKSEVEIFKSALQFLKDIAKLPEAKALKQQIRETRNKLETHIYESKLQAFRFPLAGEVRIPLKHNPMADTAAGRHYGVPDILPDLTISPFNELNWISLLGREHRGKIFPDLLRFFESAVLSQLHIPPSGSIPRVQDWENFVNGIRNHYEASYDSILAEIWLRHAPQFDVENRLRILSTWWEFRAYQKRELRVSAQVREKVSQDLAKISNAELLASRSLVYSLRMLSIFGRSRALFFSMSPPEIGELFKRANNSQVSLHKDLLVDVLHSLAQSSTQAEAEATEWFKVLKTVLEAHDMSPPPELKERLEQKTSALFKLLPVQAKNKTLSDAKLRTYFAEKDLSEILSSRFIEVRSTRYTGMTLKDALEAHEKELELSRSSTLAASYRNRVAQELRIQPHERSQVDPSEGQSITGMSDGSGTLIRKFSGVLRLVRLHSTQKQIEFLLYVAGLSDRIPDILEKADALSKKNFSYFDPMKDAVAARMEMREMSELSRALVIQSFLTGPTGILSKPKGLAEIEAFILREVPAHELDFVKIVMESVRAAEGGDYSLLLSYVLAQKSNDGSTFKISTIHILKAFLESYGVPGLKFSQFLGFAESFKEFRSVFESSQDAAMPISYISMLDLLEKQLGVKWDPSRFEVIEIKGTGSLNIAIKVLDKSINEIRILNVLRSEIEARSNFDFERFKKFVVELKKRTSIHDGLGSVGGLADLVQDSVSLEFQKARAKKMHDKSELMYSAQVKGWNVRSVRVEEVVGRGVLMHEAPGVSARHVLNENPQAYREAMRAYLSVAVKRIRGFGPDGSRMKTIITDPDIHNGQFIIDIAKRMITLIDKGQASEITIEEREFAKTIFCLAAQVSSLNRFAKDVQKFEHLYGFKISTNDLAEIQLILNRSSLMDRYMWDPLESTCRHASLSIL